jgi:ATP-binding cassette subfamily C (CFTR/MRP) protein 1
VVTLSAYQLVYGDLTTETALAAMTVFSMLQFPLQMFPNSIASILEAQLAVGRIENFLNSPEIEERPMIPRTHPTQPSIVVEDVTLCWPNGNLLLQDVEFVVPAKGKLTVVMGSVGAGKSGLLTALIGELPPRAGDITLLGSLAYAAQVPWIRHATVRENIIFDKPFNESLYTIVLHACSLVPDLKTMPAEDHSEIGEKGINLSGGQKARIALARALYAKADVLLLDDPLSAVDAHVMHQLLRTFKSSLVANSAVVLATHQEAALAYADQVVMLENQKMVFTGTPEEYCQRFDVQMPERPPADGSPTSTIISPNNQDKMNTEDKMNTCRDKVNKIYEKQPSLLRMVQSDSNKGEQNSGELVKEESKKSGHIAWSVYEDYMKSCGGDWRIYALIGGKFLTAILVTAADVWVSFWTSHIADGPGHISTEVGVGVYGVVGIGQLVYQFLLGVLIFSAALKGSVRYHNDCLSNLMRVPVSFFDTTPLGRVLNIFSKDIYTIDEQLVSTFNMYYGTMASCAITVVMILSGAPWFLIAMVPIFYIYKNVETFYNPFALNIKRFDSVLRSPVFENFSETINGLASIRAQNAQLVFKEWGYDRLHRNLRTYFFNISSNRWLSIRLMSMGGLISGSVAATVVLTRFSVNPAVAGLSVMYSLTITGALSWMVRQSSDKNSNIVAVERLLQYIETPQEAPNELADDSVLKKQGWPTQGSIEFKNVKMRYRPQLPLVLRGASFKIEPRWKVGVCGRTGAGKSSLLQALLRMVEIEDGQIEIDGVNTKDIGLHTLRNEIAIIPQDPVLFAAPLRFNLDPTQDRHAGAIEDKKMWDALQKSKLENHVEEENFIFQFLSLFTQQLHMFQV